ncbi:MAG: ion transporter [Candidatus Limnocylindrales bacterium]
MVTETTTEPIPWNSQTEDGQVLLGMPWEIFVLGCALLSILNLVLALLIRNPDIEQVVAIMDTMLVVIFAIDLLRRLRVADDDRAYMTKGWGWLDLVSIVPMLRIARVLRIVRVARIVGRMGGPEKAMRAFFANKATGGLLLVVLIAILVMEFGSLAVLWAERTSPDANITTAEDAVWYLIVTMSTVGYGDQFPVTQVGRLIGAFIIVVGVGVFGTLTGFLANVFLSPSDETVEDEAEAATEGRSSATSEADA